MIVAVPSTVPQMHSQDYLLRLSGEELEALALSHLYTVDEPAVLADAGIKQAPGLRGGYTEWQATVEGRVVSLAWDWIQLADGALHAMAAVPPRTNIRLLDSKGYDSAPESESNALWARIAQIEWQPHAAAALLSGSGDEVFTVASCGALNQH